MSTALPTKFGVRYSRTTEATNVPLIEDPTALLVFFSGFVALVFGASRIPACKSVFRYLPPIVWIYLVPVFFTTTGITPDSSPFTIDAWRTCCLVRYCS